MIRREIVTVPVTRRQIIEKLLVLQFDIRRYITGLANLWHVCQKWHVGQISMARQTLKFNTILVLKKKLLHFKTLV